jgi:D-hydroxyproline dehydrogenase subunit gamma
LITLTINDEKISVDAGTSVAAAIALTGVDAFRRSVGGEPRFPLCGMGLCFECSVTVNEVRHQRSCMLAAEDAMVIRTDG